jgi:hypothetical protein
MRFSNDGFSWASWVPYAIASEWPVLAVEGVKTVHGQFKDGAGNVSAAVSDSITLDLKYPTGTIIINGGAVYTNVSTVSLALSASDSMSGIAAMRFWTSAGGLTPWEPYQTSRSWTFPTGDGIKSLYVIYRDGAGREAWFWDVITVDSKPPSGTILIQGGSGYAHATSVTLSVSATDANGVAQMRFSNDGSTWDAWRPYATSASWMLAGGDGTKQVFAQFSDSSQNVSGSVSDTIVLDTVAPTGSVQINGGAAFTHLTTATLTLSATDNGSAVSQMRFSNDGTVWGAWAAYGVSSSWTLSDGDGPKTVQAQFKDVADNVSATVSDDIVLESQPPAVSIAQAAGQLDPTRLSTVAFEVTFSESVTGFEAADVALSGNAQPSVVSISGSGAVYRVTVGGMTQSGLVTIALPAGVAFDGAGNGNLAPTAVDDTVMYDADLPSGAVAINSNAAYCTAQGVTLSLSASDATSGVGRMRFSNDGVTWSAWMAFAPTASWSLAAVSR